MAKVIQSYTEVVALAADQFNAVTLAQNERAKNILACFKPGQFIPVHAPGVDLSLVILEGSGRLAAGDQETLFRAGTTAFIAAGEKRGLQAETQTVAFFVVTPPPTMADHTGVAAGIQRGSWQPA